MDFESLKENLAPLFSFLKALWRFELYNSGGSTVALNQIVIAIGLIIVGLIISKRVSKSVGRQLQRIGKLENNTAHVLQKIVSYLFISIIVLIALPIAGIPITIFTVLGGALAIGVGFGAQNLFNNLISGFIIMFEKPIRIGDVVELDGSQGKIIDIGNRCVRIKRGDGVDVMVPNSFFIEQVVVNWTLHDTNLRGCVKIGVAYGSPIEKVRDLLLQAAMEESKIHNDPEPVVLFDDFGDNALAFSVNFWSTVMVPIDLRKVTSDLRFRIDHLFREHNISISFPQRDLHLDTIKPLEIRVLKDQ